MPDFSYDKGDEGITDKAGWLKQFSSFSLLISIIAANTIFRIFWARLLENCWDCFVLFSNMLYQPMEEDVIVVAVFHQGMPHCQWRKTVWCHLKYIVQINGQGSALLNTTAVIFFFHCTLDSNNSKELQLQLLQSLNRSLINWKPLALDTAPCFTWALPQLPVVLLMCALRGHKAAYLCESGWDSKMQGLLRLNSLECLILQGC